MMKKVYYNNKKDFFIIDDNLYYQCQILINNNKKNFDGWFMVDGEIEGAGKSWLAKQIMICLDPTHNEERTVFSFEEFKKAIKEAKRYQGIIWDEANEGTNATESMTTKNNTLQRLCEQIRQKNLFIALVRPSFFDFSKYYAVHRTWFLVSANITFNSETQSFDRGKFNFYSRKRKKYMYLKGKKLQNRNVIYPNFSGFFPECYAGDLDTYYHKKAVIK